MSNQNNFVKEIPPLKKNYPASHEIRPLDFVEMGEQVGNIYKMVVILGKRANQISQQTAEEIRKQLDYFNQLSPYDPDREGQRNPEREKVFKEYERRLKPTLQAIDEFIAGKLAYIDPYGIDPYRSD